MSAQIHFANGRGGQVLRWVAIALGVVAGWSLLDWALDFPVIRAFGGQVPAGAGNSAGLAGLGFLILAVITSCAVFRRPHGGRLKDSGLGSQWDAFEGGQFCIIAVDTDGVIREVNPGAEQMLGYPRSELVGVKTPLAFHLESEVSARAAEMATLLGRPVKPGFDALVAQARDGRKDERELTYVRKDGSRFPVMLRVTALRDRAGELTGFLFAAEDITIRKKAEYALRTSEERLHRVLEHADCLVWEAEVELADGDWRWNMTVHPSALYRRLSGRSMPDGNVGLWYQFQIPEQEEMNRRSRAAMQGELPGYAHEFRLLRSGETIWISETVSISKEAAGRFWLVGVAIDITENRQAVAARDELNKRLGKLGSMVPGLIYQFRLRPDGSSCFPYSSTGIEEIFGVNAEEVRVDASKVLAAFHPDDQSRVRDSIQTSAKTLQKWHCEFRVRLANGRVRWLLGNSMPEQEPDGSVLWHGFITDISERKAAEEALVHSSKEVRDLKVAMDEHSIVAITDPAGRILYANDKFCKASGYERAELIGRDFRILNSGHHSKEFMQNLWSTSTRGDIWKGEIKNRAKNGSFYWVDTTIVPFLDADGKPAQYIAINSDITERKQLEESLVHARDQALEASKLKSEFLATMSHEIRTPMNAIIGMGSLLKDTPLNARQAEMTRTILGGAESLLEIINDILDFSRIESGRIRIDSVEFSFSEVVREVMALLTPRAAQKRLNFSYDIAPWSGAILLGDDGRLRQVLLNLIGNAVKFTDRGEVTVSVRAVSETTTRTRLRVEIRDTGVGIPREARGRLFQPFVQADGSTTRRFGGTGLGLAISRQLVELMGGEIDFESEVGQGSLFWVEIGFQHSKTNRKEPTEEDLPNGATSLDAKTPRKLYGLRLLLVEDNPANRQVGLLMLEQLGCVVDIATNGQAALEKLSGKSFDAVLMDCQMPVMDGFETTKRIRSGTLPGVARDLPVIALTAYARLEDKEKCLAAGMTDYISKPIRIHELEAAFDRMGIESVYVAQAMQASQTEPVLDQRVLDAARALIDSRGQSVLRRVLKDYFDEEEPRLNQLEQLALIHSGDELAKEAHSFGGTAVAFGGLEVRRVALEIEELARNSDWVRVEPRLAELREACVRLKKELVRQNLA